MTHTAEEPGHHPVGSLCRQPAVNPHTSCAQTGNTAPVNAAVRILHSDHHTHHTRSNQRISARASLSLMRTGLQRDIGTSTARRVAGHCQRLGLGMRASTARCMTHSNKPASLISNNASNRRVRTCSPFGTARSRHSKLHPP
jgi:hypothetical protein